MSSGSENIEGCASIPMPGEDIKIALPFGGEIKAMRDFTQGIPDQCTLNFSLLMQLPPLLGSLTCFIKMLGVIGKIGDFLKNPLDPVEAPKAAAEAVDAIAELALCIPVPPFPNIVLMICDILKLIVGVLRCVIEALEGIIQIEGGFNFATAEGNPALLEVLNCARDNSKVTAAHVLAALKPLTPLLNTVKSLGEVAQIPLEFPDLDELADGAGEDMSETISKLRETVTAMEKIIEGIPS